MRSIKNRSRKMLYINFARNCMIELVSKKSGGVNEISSSDLVKIEQILNKYKR